MYRVTGAGKQAGFVSDASVVRVRILHEHDYPAFGNLHDLEPAIRRRAGGCGEINSIGMIELISVLGSGGLGGWRLVGVGGNFARYAVPIHASISRANVAQKFRIELGVVGSGRRLVSIEA